MLGDGCPRPQEIIRQYAEQSNAQISLIQQQNNNHNHHHHHHSTSSIPYQVSNHPNHLVLTIHRHGNDDNITSSFDDFNNKCKTCLKLQFPTHHHHNHRYHRQRRVSTPTNLKLKEWFTTINHKWARIKRQVILHHQRQQPLINEDNYGTNEMTCCHVSKVPKNVKTRNLKELLNGHNEPYRFPATNLHIQCKCLPSQRYCLINGYGTTTTRYQHRKQQFGRWHEEPAFGSRYAFDNEITFNMNRQTNSVTNTPSAKTKLTTTTMQNDMNSNSKLTQPNDIDDNGDGVNDDVDDDDDDNSNNRITMTNNNNNNDQNHRHHTALIKSSSIDTIAAFFNDPIEEIRRLHFRPSLDHQTNDVTTTSTMVKMMNGFNGNNNQFDSDSMNISHFNNNNNNNQSTKPLLHRANSFDNDHHQCQCNCSDWLLDIDDDLNDPFQSLPETIMAKNDCIINLSNDTAMNELRTVFNHDHHHQQQSSLTNDFTLSSSSNNNNNHSIMNGGMNFIQNSSMNGFQSLNNNIIGHTATNLTQQQQSKQLQFNNLNGPLVSGDSSNHHHHNHNHRELTTKQDNNKNNNNGKNCSSLSGTTSSGSSSSSMSTNSNSSGSGSNGRFCNRSFGPTTVPSLSTTTSMMMMTKSLQNTAANAVQQHDNSNGHLSFHSTSLNLNNNNNNNDLMDSNFFILKNDEENKNKIDEINHHSSCSSSTSSSSSSSSSTAATTATMTTDMAANVLTSSTTHPPLSSLSASQCNVSTGIAAAATTTTTALSTNIKNNSMQSTPLSTTTTSSSMATTIMSTILNHHQNCPPIIDLLKEFDVCFDNHDQLDDDSSTLTDNSSTHSSNSPPKQNVHNETMIMMANCSKNISATTTSTSSSSILHTNDSNSFQQQQQQQKHKSYHHISSSSLPPPTISPPPPPQPPLSCCIETPVWPNNIIIGESLSLSSSSSMNPSNIHLSCSSQQVPLGDNNNNKQETTNETATNQQCLKDIELICLNEVIEEVQETIQKCKRGPICFDPRCITLKRRIGNGYFGDVFLATIPSLHGSSNINLAVKMLKSHAVPQQKAEILREAQTMAKLDHRHIVRLIGVCENDPFMLVMELAPLGPLNKYLQNHGQNLTDMDILRLMLQVAKAMQYLEDVNYVHRDLAARNILLVNEKFAKVSDFGMSRALGQGKDYYKARSASKWPLKWYAPECIYYYKFSSKSDVWSFGVALWEAMSRGEMPYQGMDGQDILRMFNENRRLPKPENCSVIIYQIMWSCWQFKPEDRLNFANIVDQLMHYLDGK
ncbi:hypothetical protein DERF_004923 [Dermatophagoides farinae]|uniref:Protein kinase domain-containing protein n=1 Tax=Dermatophagoides farinae TaxID=6954 RepID=A0A922I748_DERFA|nr:hypothetical protein DERF_004923 [Dermatophagoides farinae]